jgi:hypothetical protein
MVRIGIGEEDQEGTKALMVGLADMQIAEAFQGAVIAVQISKFNASQ